MQQNKPEEVETVSGDAIKTVPKSLEAAIKHLCQLKAIGPATASGMEPPPLECVPSMSAWSQCVLYLEVPNL